MNDDTRILVYLSVMALLLSCVGAIYGLVLFGGDILPETAGNRISPITIIVIGLIVSFVNGLSMNIISDQISEKMKRLPSVIKFGLPILAAILTLAISIIIAIISL